MKHPLRIATLLVFLTLACSEKETPRSSGSEGDSTRSSPPGASESPSRPSRGSSTAAAPLLEEEAWSSKDLGALHGEIRFEGDPPERWVIGADKNADCKHHPEVDHLSDTQVVNDGKVQYVYVYLKSGYYEEAIPPAPEEDVLIDQRACVYTPHVVGVQVGTRVLVKNSDPTNHNVHLYDKKNGLSTNRNMGPGQEPLTFEFTRPEHEIKLKCDIHPWMGGIVFIEEHPWFAVTDAAGAFRIPDVPPGEYTVEAIHESFGKVRGKVTVLAGRSTGFYMTLED